MEHVYDRVSMGMDNVSNRFPCCFPFAIRAIMCTNLTPLQVIYNIEWLADRKGGKGRNTIAESPHNAINMLYEACCLTPAYC